MFLKAIDINGKCEDHFHLLLRLMNVVYNRPRYDSNLPLDPLAKPSSISCARWQGPERERGGGGGRCGAAVSSLGYRLGGDRFLIPSWG